MGMWLKVFLYLDLLVWTSIISLLGKKTHVFVIMSERKGLILVTFSSYRKVFALRGLCFLWS